MQLKQYRHQRLIGFAFEGAIRVEVKVFDQLLGDGRATLSSTTSKVIDYGTGDTAYRNAFMLIKRAILGGNQCINQWLRHVI